MGQKEGIHLAKDLAVDICEEIIKIIIHGGSDEEAMPSDVADVNSKVDDWFKKVWAKITKFFQDLGEKIKKEFEHYGKVIVDFFNNMVDKYQKLIIDALKKDGKVILAEGQTLVIAVLDEAVKLAVDLIHKIAGNDNEANGIKDLWQKLSTTLILMVVNSERQ